VILCYLFSFSLLLIKNLISYCILCNDSVPQEQAISGMWAPDPLCLPFFEFLVPEATYDMIVDHANGLHEGITNGCPNELEPSFLQIFGGQKISWKAQPLYELAQHNKAAG